jgi:glycerol-3-phosphate acyltransferase PlsY
MAGGYGSALGFGGGVGVTTFTGAWPVLALILLAAVVVVVSLRTTIIGAALAALQCWGLYATFLVGVRGDLTVDEHTTWVLALLVQLAARAFRASAAMRVIALVTGTAAKPSPVRF